MEIFRAIIRKRPPRPGVHEIPREAYLASLSEVDRARIEDLLSQIPTVRTALAPGIRLGILAVGSAVKPEELRYHPVRDLDLRILNSALPDSQEREETVREIQKRVRSYLLDRRITYREKDHTLEIRMVKGYDGSGERLVDFLDWYNNDPSFETTPDNGHPLHLSISGIDNFDLDTYVRKNRESKSFFSVLEHDK